MSLLDKKLVKRIKECESEINNFQNLINEAFAKKSSDSKYIQKHQQACQNFRNYNNFFDNFRKKEIRKEISDGAQPWRTIALTYLYIDPWHFNSGYFKEKIIISLLAGKFSIVEEEFIQEILLKIVDSRHRREFRLFCQLSLKLTDNFNLQKELKKRLFDLDEGISIRSMWMLCYLFSNSNGMLAELNTELQEKILDKNIKTADRAKKLLNFTIV